jgi:hypothetical protein
MLATVPAKSSARRSAALRMAAKAAAVPLPARRRGAAPFGLPSFTPRAFAAPRASLVRLVVSLSGENPRWPNVCTATAEPIRIRPISRFHDAGPTKVFFEGAKSLDNIAENTSWGRLVLTNRERQVLDNVVDQLRHIGDVSPAAAVLRDWLEVHAIKPLEAVADVTFAYDRHERMMQLETARSLSKRSN